MNEVTDFDTWKPVVQPDDILGSLPGNADALDRRSTSIFGSGEGKVGGLDLHQASNGIDCVHGVLILLVESEMKIFSAQGLEALLPGTAPSTVRAPAAASLGLAGRDHACSVCDCLQSRGEYTADLLQRMSVTLSGADATRGETNLVDCASNISVIVDRKRDSLSLQQVPLASLNVLVQLDEIFGHGFANQFNQNRAVLVGYDFRLDCGSAW